MRGILLCDCALVNMQPPDQYNTYRTHFVFLLQITVFSNFICQVYAFCAFTATFSTIFRVHNPCSGFVYGIINVPIDIKEKLCLHLGGLMK